MAGRSSTKKAKSKAAVRKTSPTRTKVPAAAGKLHRHQIKWYGWAPDLPDARDQMYMAPAAVHLPERVDLTKQCPPVYDQGQLGSCTGNAIAGAIQFDRIKQGIARPREVPSRLFIYFNERVIEHTVDQDSGAQIRDGIKSVAKLGVCFEGSAVGQWAYDIAKFETEPPPPCYKAALKCRAVTYSRLTPRLDQLKGCLASGYPFVFGFTVYQSFESKQVAKTGKLDMPKSKETVIGGHAVLAVGYDDAQSRFIVRNSWAADWGMKGYFTIPYDYLTNTNLADDFWTIRVVA
jgi:C1A family cysteine protease